MRNKKFPTALIYLLSIFFIKSLALANIEIANTLYDNGEFAKAASMYEEILKKDGENSFLFQNLGNAHYKLDDVSKALFYFEKSLQDFPYNDSAKYNLEFIQKKIGETPYLNSHWSRFFTIPLPLFLHACILLLLLTLFTFSFLV